jgi:hypothetical protein
MFFPAWFGTPQWISDSRRLSVVGRRPEVSFQFPPALRDSFRRAALEAGALRGGNGKPATGNVPLELRKHETQT